MLTVENQIVIFGNRWRIAVQFQNMSGTRSLNEPTLTPARLRASATANDTAGPT